LDEIPDLMTTASTDELDLEKCAAAAVNCACFNFRKASRVVTQLFDDALAPIGLRSTQLVILICVAITDSISVVRLAHELVMDRSTVARNLKPLEREGLLTIVPGDDRRTRLVRLTPAGRAKLIAAVPLWEQAQGGFVARLGADRWNVLLENLTTTVDLMRGSM
jgi:DNA-binding MarR family transcriptional regulator